MKCENVHIAEDLSVGTKIHTADLQIVRPKQEKPFWLIINKLAKYRLATVNIEPCDTIYMSYNITVGTVAE